MLFALLISTGAGLLALQPSSTTCTTFDRATGGCSSSGSIAGGGVHVGASQDSAGSGSSGDGDVSVDDSSGGAAEPFDPSVLRIHFDCPGAASCATTPAVHLSDLISFHPKAPTIAMEPNGWAVAHLDANFVGNAAVDVQSGALLGGQAQVRFTPGRFNWNYGDGTKRTSADGGATWAQLKVPEFSPTSTSHVFQHTGTFSVSATVTYTAEYRFAGQPWQAISGSLQTPAQAFTVVVGDAKTVLVDQDCAVNPAGPGC
jgi:hypothetical protein